MSDGVILIVDSDRDCVARLVDLLTPLPFTVVVAFDQLHAYEISLQNTIDLYLIAHGLSDGNGIKLFARLLQTQHGLTGVLLARHVDLRVIYEAIGAGFQHVLPKPIDADQFFTVLSETFGQIPENSTVSELQAIKEYTMNLPQPDLEAIAMLTSQDIRERMTTPELIAVIRSVDYPFAGKERLEYFDRDTLERVVCLVRRWSQQRLEWLRGRHDPDNRMRATA